MMRTARRLIVLANVLSGLAVASTVYSNTTTDTGDTLAYAANGYTQIGDQIHLAGTDRSATLATVQFFNLGTAGTITATLRLFNVGPNAGNPVGSQIGSNIAISGIVAPAGNVFNEPFALPGILVPDDLVFTVSVDSQSAGVDIIGLDMFEPPTTGSSDSRYAIANNGTIFLRGGTTNEDVFFELQATNNAATPEPATSGFAVLALLAFAFLRRRSHNTSF